MIERHLAALGIDADGAALYRSIIDGEGFTVGELAAISSLDDDRSTGPVRR